MRLCIPGKITEIGMPIGHDFRRIVVAEIASMTQALQWALWVNGHDHVTPFPPAWFAAGINSRRMVFAHYPHASIADLKLVFSRPLFKLIVLDGAYKLTAAEWSFLAHQARRNSSAVVILRPYRLSNQNGNVWTALRLNIASLTTSGPAVQMLKGGVA